MLMAEASRRLKVRARKLGSCIDKARPFYDALNMSKQAQQQCQIAAVKYQRANGKSNRIKVVIKKFFHFKSIRCLILIF